MTVGQHGGRDYGYDHQTYPPHPADSEAHPRDGHSGWAAGSPPAAEPADYHSEYPPVAGSGYPQAGREGYPVTGAASYPVSDLPARDYQAPVYPDRGSPDQDYGGNGYPASRDPEYDYRTAGYPGEGYPAADYRRAGYPEPDYPTASLPRARALAADPWDPWDGRRPANGGPPRHSGADRVITEPRSATGGAGGEGGRTGRKRKGLPLWQELPLLLIIAFCLAILVRTFLLQAFFIPSGSMEDTLIAGDRVLVNKVIYNFREPARGEVVVFRGTDAWAPVNIDDGDIGAFGRIGRALGDLVGVSRPGEKDFIKRIIGLPGDTVSCCDVEGRVFVNGQPLDEEYVIRNSPLDDGPPAAQDCRTRRFDEVLVQPGQVFVMGDHRQVSQDSRCQGQVPIDNIIGRAFIIVWPNDRWNGLSQPATFDSVPGAAVAAAPATGPPPPTVPAAPAQLAFVLPILLPVGVTFRSTRRVSRLGRHSPGRRLA